jgi:hypothetical protein
VPLSASRRARLERLPRGGERATPYNTEYNAIPTIVPTMNVVIAITAAHLMAITGSVAVVEAAGVGMELLC